MYHGLLSEMRTIVQGPQESGMFEAVKKKEVERGNFFRLFATRARAVRYLSVILIGVPIWYTVGILITFSPEIGKAMGMAEVPSAKHESLCLERRTAERKAS